MGVTFSFAEGLGGTAVYGNTYGTVGLGLTDLSDPVLDGPSDGTLTLQFVDPTTLLQFGVAMGPPSGPPTVTVALSGPGGFTITVPFTTAIISGSFPEGQFTYNDPNNPITQAVLTFPSDAGPFLIDNLTYDVQDLSDPGVPEPASLTLLGCGVLLIGAVSQAGRRCAA